MPRRRYGPDVEVDYGTLTPQDPPDRFGQLQTYTLWTRDNVAKVVPTDLLAVVRRLGLQLLDWGGSPYHGTHTYKLDIHGRAMHILHSYDGRVKIEFDGTIIYREVKRQRKGPDGAENTYIDVQLSQEQVAQEREMERQLRLDEVRARLKDRERYGQAT